MIWKDKQLHQNLLLSSYILEYKKAITTPGWDTDFHTYMSRLIFKKFYLVYC